jgi:hypothetical protein
MRLERMEGKKDEWEGKGEGRQREGRRIVKAGAPQTKILATPLPASIHNV